MQRMTRLAKGLAVLLSVCVCVWCAGESLQGWLRENGGEALLMAAGMGVEEQPEATPEGAVLSTIGVAVSIVVNLAILTLGVYLGSQIIALIPESVVNALVYLVPALYGAMLMQMILYAPKIALIAVPLSIVTLAISKTGIFDSSMAILISVFGSIIIGRLLMKTGWLDDQK